MKRIVLLGLLLSGCVTTHEGFETESAQAAGLSLSCTERRDLKSEYFQMLSCTVENAGSEWIEVEVEHVSFPGATDTVKVSTPEEIQAFVDVHRFKEDKDRRNSQVAVASVALVGLTAAAVGGSQESSPGAAAAIGAMGTSLGMEEHREWSNVQHASPVYSKEHLLGHDIKLPPGEFTRKFVLLETSLPRLPRTVQVCLSKPVVECLDLSLPSR